MKEQHYFASANTCEGFKNHFNSINPEDSSFTYILKGGSGTGKSTFMKSIAEHFSNKGYNIEYFHCSSDMDSLDGVRVIEKKVAIVDGTAPHVTECTLPQVKEKILNVGEFIGDGIRTYREKLENILSVKSQRFKTAYSYLSACRELVKLEIYKSSLNENALELKNKAKEILKTINLKKQKKKKTTRSLFSSCIDKGGVNRLDNNYTTTINLDMSNLFDGAKVLDIISTSLEKNNIPHVNILSPLLDTMLDGIYLPQNDLLITNNQTDKNKLNKLITTLLSRAGNEISLARSTHKKLEKYYIKAMNFDKLNVLKKEIIEEIEKFKA